MNIQEIEEYLREMGEILPKHLKNLGLPGQTIRIFTFGGIIMAYTGVRSATYDVDFKFLDFLSIAEERAEKRNVSVPTHAFMSAAQEVARNHRLRHDWINDDGAMFIEMYLDNSHHASYMEYWKNFGLIHVFFPTLQCQLVLKILSGRPKDIPDVMTLRHILKLFSREETLRVVNDFIDPQLQKVFFETMDVEAFIQDLS